MMKNIEAPGIADMTSFNELDSKIAVIGVALSLPGANSICSFERLIFNGGCELSYPPSGTLNQKDWIERAGYVGDWPLFDYRLYGLSLRDSVIIDPQQRMFMQHCWKAAESAGFNPKAMPSRTAVISTASDTNYANVIKANAGIADNYHPFEIEIGSNKEQQSLRVSHVLNLRGPSYGVQSACSSGLLVIHTAMRSLMSGDCDLALTGGASLPFPLHQGYRYVPGMNLSKSGMLRSFDRDADGMVPGFGCIVFLLKRFLDAQRDRDSILAVLCASSINNDGNNKASYTSPSSLAIAENISSLLVKARMDSSNIDIVEAHGSGTYLGDVVESAALKKIFSDSRRGPMKTAVASVKASIGHLDTVAGLAGLLRTVVQLRSRRIAPAANFGALNPHISFDKGPLYIPRSSAPNPGIMTSIVNSLGIGGTNCALLVQSPPPIVARCESSYTPLCISVGASTRDRLLEMVRNLAVALRHSEVDIRDVARSLSRRAAGKPVVASFVAANIEGLVERLEGFDARHLDTAQDACPSLEEGDGRIVDFGVSEIDPSSRVDMPAGDRPVCRETRVSDDIERTLGDIWKSALSIAKVDDSTSFSNEGGHSILALTVINKIHHAFEVCVGLDWINTYDNFGQQLQEIKRVLATPERSAGSLVRLVRSARSAPRFRLVLVHASISGYEVYKPLCEYLADDIEILAVDSYNLYADEEHIIRTGEALAELYSAQIVDALTDLTIPIFIGGWSLGGMLANLVAATLPEHFSVAGLIAIDSVLFCERYAALFEDDALPYFIDDASLLVERFGKARYLQQMHRLNYIFRVERGMARAFQPVVRHVPILNIIAQSSRIPITDVGLQSAFDAAKFDNGWGSCKKAEIVRVNAHHAEIVDEINIAAIAGHINRFAEVTCSTI